MTRLRSLIPVLGVALAAALALSACGGTTGNAATVNDASISESEFRDELDMLRDHPQFAEVVYGATVPTEGGTVDSGVAGEVLRTRILVELVDQEFDERNLEIADEDLQEADTTFMPELQTLLADLPDEYRDRFRNWNAQLIVLRRALEADAAERPDEVTDEQVEAFYDEYQGIFTGEEACARHVLLDTDEEAEEVIADLEAGADFGEVASERSTDPSAETNDGDLGCTGPGTYVPEFEEAVWEGPVGEIQGPIQTQFGYHVILVDSRGRPGYDDVADDIRAFLESPTSRDGQQLLNLTIQRLVATADVSVNSRYGRWDSDTQSIEPPQGSATTVGGEGDQGQ